MKKTNYIKLFFQSIKIFLICQNIPLFVTLILTDRCNLSCRHCCLNNYHSEDKRKYKYKKICSDMKKLYKKGARIICFSGGEIGLWHDEDYNISDLIEAAKEIGFMFVTLATNGTIRFDYGNSDLNLISIDGSKEIHDYIRGETFDIIIHNIQKSSSDKNVIFMELNQINKNEIYNVCQIAKNEPNIKAVSFNFHTPFEGTEDLALSNKEKEICCNEIIRLIKEGYPILNLKSCFPYIISNTFKKPCKQLMVIDYGEEIICNRCIKYNGLCNNCGYFETAEISLIFSGKIKVILDAIKTYWKYL